MDDKLKNLIAHGKPLNRTNPAFENLSPAEAEQFDSIVAQKKKRMGKMIDPEQKQQLNDLQEKIRDGTPINEQHPGFSENLTPNQQDEFEDLAQKKEEPLAPEEKAKLDFLKNLIAHGQPLDLSHPGLLNLTPK